MLRITVNQTVYEVEEKTRLEELAKKVQRPEDPLILLAYANGKLRELTYELEKDCYVRFVTLEEQAGYMTYKRSAMFLFLTACEDVLGKGAADNIAINYSIGNSTFCELKPGTAIVNESLAGKIQHRMEDFIR